MEPTSVNEEIENRERLKSPDQTTIEINIPTKKLLFPSELLTEADVNRLRRMFDLSPKRPSEDEVNVRALFCPVVSKHFYNIRTSDVCLSYIRHDTSYKGFRPTLSKNFPEAVGMRLHVMKIGKGHEFDLDLRNFGNCTFTSIHQATVFYDESMDTYEMINYSEWGTFVNDGFYSLDYPHQNRKYMPFAHNKRPKSYNDNWCYCNCEKPKFVVGSKNTAILEHGSVLTIGCKDFVFSLVYNPEEEEKS